MPLLVTYRGAPIKRRRNTPDGLLLVFYAAKSGARGHQLFVSQEQWRRFGKTEFCPTAHMPDVRQLAAAFWFNSTLE